MDQREKNTDQRSVLQAAMYAYATDIYTSAPGIIQSINATGTRVEVQLAIQEDMLGEDGTYTPTTISVLVDVMVVRTCSGGFAITLPIVAGDECLVIFAHRCIDNWATNGGVQPQAQSRLHSISDGFALCGAQSDPNAIPAVSPNLQIRSLDGSAYIEMTPTGQINILAPQGVTITTPHNVSVVAGQSAVVTAPTVAVMATQSISLESEQGVSIVAPAGVNIVGNLTVEGTITP